MTNSREITTEEFEAISKRKEDLFFDRKGSRIKPSDLQGTVVAFANANGGLICVGLDDDGKLEENKDVSNFDNIIKDGVYSIDPLISDIECKFLKYNESFVLCINIPKSENVHSTSKAEVFLRVNACNKKLKQSEIQSLKYKKGEIKFEEEIKNVDLSGIVNSEYLKGYLTRFNIKTKPLDYITANGYVFNNKPKNLCLICFHDRPQNILKCGVKINLFEMSKTSRKYAYERSRKKLDKNIFGPLEIIIIDTIKEISNILLEMNIKYPKEAIIEGVVNALIHRDYSVSEDVVINIYDNLIEIISPGGFPGDIKESDLNLRKIKRYLRNPVICNFLFSISSLEPDFKKRLNQDQGEGVRTIFNSMKKAGLKEPEFKEIDNKVYLYLRHENARSYEQKILDYLNEHDSIANKDARDLLGEEDKEKIKNVFLKLEKKQKIERLDHNVPKSKVRYKRFNSNIKENKNKEREQLKLL